MLIQVGAPTVPIELIRSDVTVVKGGKYNLRSNDSKKHKVDFAEFAKRRQEKHPLWKPDKKIAEELRQKKQ